jgi:hypothetical protein
VNGMSAPDTARAQIQIASPFPPAIFANVGLMFVVCDVYPLLSQALARGIAVDVASARGYGDAAREHPDQSPEVQSYLGDLDDSSCCGRRARLIRSQEHSILFCSLLDHFVFCILHRQRQHNHQSWQTHRNRSRRLPSIGQSRSLT